MATSESKSTAADQKKGHKPSRLRPPTPRTARKWKEVKIEEKDLYSNDMQGFVCLEELESYSTNDLVSSRPQAAGKAQAAPKKRKNSKRSKLTQPKKVASKKRKTDELKCDTVKDEPVAFPSESATLVVDDAAGPAPANEWSYLGVPSEICKALVENNFVTPTPIQKVALPAAIQNWQDIIGAAETGSGKTLAFGIPILARVMELKVKQSEQDKKPLYCLILAPTRELALQVCQHITDAAKYCNVQCVSIVGGLSTQKQERLLRKSPEIVVATPGRLNSLLKDGHPHLLDLKTVPLFAVDEVDRMLEHGHFKDLTELFERMQSEKTKRQTFIFSATLTLPKYHNRWSKASSKQEDEMQKLMDKLKINAKAKVIDLTRKNVTATGLNQWRILCSAEEKDLYLYYFLLLHPGRTLVFVNSIGSAKRLCSIFSILKKEPLQLHAGKQQKQRLKALDRFSSRENSLLIATDVAARGLDIKNVDHVVHYQLPKDPNVYIHRSGRTARACSDGQSLILESSDDFQAYKKICEVLKLPTGVPNLPIEHLYLLQMKKRLDIARKIDKQQHTLDKKSTNESWMKRTAKALDIDEDDSEPDTDKIANKKAEEKSLKALKGQLEGLLKLPILPQGFSGCYPTMSGGLQKLGLKAT